MATTSSEAPLRVLAVDDEPGMRRAIARSLAPRYLVEEASNAREALERLTGAPFEIAIVDVRMPEVDGFELLEALKLESPETEVIMITGSHSDQSGKLVRAIRERAFYFLEKPFERDVLVALVDRAAEVVRLARQNREYLGQIKREAQRMEEDLERARRFQLSLLPREIPRFRRLRIAAHYAPHSRVGGDLYDFYRPRADTLVAAIFDLAGHGVSAALLAGILKVHLDAVVAGRLGPAQALAELNRRWLGASQGIFATLFLGTIGPEGNSLRYASAGHPPPFVVRAGGGVETFDSTGLPIGLFAEATYTEIDVPLGRGDLVFLYSDGLTEAPNPAGHPLGMEAVRITLERFRDKEPAQVVEAMRRQVEEWCGPAGADDDVSFFAIRRTDAG